MNLRASSAGGVLLALLLSFSPAELAARPNIRDAFFTVYANAVGTPLDTVPSHPTHCGVCHFDFSGGGLRNPYGQQVEAALPNFPNNPNGRRQAIISVQNSDADGDGFSTLIEVTDTINFANTPTFPGLTPANVQGVSNVALTDLFMPNRPTTQALVRVIAIDNAYNSGHDDSNAVFTVQAPPGGFVPTTLRDFDLPGSQPFEAGILNPPTACAPCHGNYDVAVEPYRNWQGSMMSQASRDLLFEACLAVANQDAPDSGDLCLRCHLPRGWLRGRSVPTDGSQMLESDETGVACDLCHRLVDPFYDPGVNPLEDQAILAGLADPPADFGNGMFVVDPTGARRGPFTNANTGHPVLVSPFHREAALCGTCHDVSNPAFQKDGQGNYVPNALNQPAGSFSAHVLMPIERTYSEWFYSAYNTPQGVYAPQFGGNKQYVSTCQDCHMRDVTGKGCNLAEAPVRTDLPLHDMTGGSTWLPGLLPILYPNIPNEVNPAALQAGIARARYMLQNAATLSTQQQGDTLAVTVTNETGHKLPTGYPEGRRMWLNLRFYDATQTLIAESGAYDPLTGVLSHDAEAKIYEAKPGLDETVAPLVGVDPGPSFHFVLNNKIFKDNRIPPRGFANLAYADFGGTPVEATYADGQYWDETPYAIPPGAASVAITLYYQSTSKEYVEFLRDENATNTKGDELYNLWSSYDRCPPEAMRTATLGLVSGSRPGDLDCDGDVDFDDISPFVLALSGYEGYHGAYPTCYWLNADCNSDGTVDFGDINAFVALLGS
jgi:hypothetical protein